jgi:DNA-binding PadR family transcriptional regulator
VLQQLQDEGMVEVTDEGGRRVFALTDQGRTYVQDHAEEIGKPWESDQEGPGQRAAELVTSLTALGAAVEQVARFSDEAQAARALEALEQARRTMYRILAAEGEAPAAPAE